MTNPLGPNHSRKGEQTHISMGFLGVVGSITDHGSCTNLGSNSGSSANANTILPMGMINKWLPGLGSCVYLCIHM